MASGGTTALLSAAILTSVYTNTSNAPAVMNVSFCNQSPNDTAIRLAISTASTNAAVSPADYVEYNRSIAGSGIYQRTGFVLAPNESVYAYDQQGVCSVRVDGFEGTN